MDIYSQEYINPYRQQNLNFRKRFIHSIGWHGLFSELLLMCNSMIYAYNNGHRFELNSTNTGFAENIGWKLLWVPCFPESINPLFKKINNSGINNITKSWFQKLFLKAMPHVVIHEQLNKIILNHDYYNSKFRYPNAINSVDSLAAFNWFLCLIMQSLQDEVKHEISSQITDLNLPLNYCAFQVRRGDKVLTGDAYARKHDISEYFDILNIKNVQNIYVLTDDYNAIRELRSGFPNYNWIHRVERKQHGYHNSDFIKLPLNSKKRQLIKLISDYFICVNSDFFIGPFSSNFSRAVGITRLNKCTESVDIDKYSISVGYLQPTSTR